MSEIYQILSITENDPGRYSENALNEAVQIKFTQAESYRNSFAATTLTRLRWAELVNNDTDSDLAIFWEKMPRQVFMHVIMMDFYYGVPTTVDCVLSKLGTRTGARIIAESIDQNLVCKKNSDRDHRVKWLQPSIKMVQAYEQRAAQWEYRRVIQEDRLAESTLVKALIAFDLLRKRYLPGHIYDGVKFNLTDEMLEHKLEIDHPMLEIVA